MVIGGTALVAGPGAAGAWAPLRRELQEVSIPPARPAARVSASERIVQGEVLPRMRSRGVTTHEYLYVRPGARMDVRALASARQALNMYSRAQAASRPGRGRRLDEHA